MGGGYPYNVLSSYLFKRNPPCRVVHISKLKVPPGFEALTSKGNGVYFRGWRSLMLNVLSVRRLS